MSTRIASIKNTGGTDAELTFVNYFGGEKKGQMLQITQGIGGCDTPGYIQLSVRDAYHLIQIITEWIKDKSMEEANRLDKELSKLKIERKTIFHEAVDCERFIANLKILDIPLRLLGN